MSAAPVQVAAEPDGSKQAQPHAYAPLTGESYKGGGSGATTMAIDLACYGQGSQYLIETYYRNGGAPGTTAYLRCGSSSTWGLRHIETNHESDWNYYASFVGSSWEDFADYAIEQTLAAPSQVTYRFSNDTWAFRAPIEIRDFYGNIVTQFVARVVVADNSSNIITAFPE